MNVLYFLSTQFLKKMLQDYSYDSHRNLKFISSELRRTPST